MTDVKQKEQDLVHIARACLSPGQGVLCGTSNYKLIDWIDEYFDPSEYLPDDMKYCVACEAKLTVWDMLEHSL